MQNYTKKSEKDILRIREILLEKGVDEEKVSLNGRKPYEMCPQKFYKQLQ